METEPGDGCHNEYDLDVLNFRDHYNFKVEESYALNPCKQTTPMLEAEQDPNAPAATNSTGES